MFHPSTPHVQTYVRRYTPHLLENQHTKSTATKENYGTGIKNSEASNSPDASDQTGIEHMIEKNQMRRWARNLHRLGLIHGDIKPTNVLHSL